MEEHDTESGLLHGRAKTKLYHYLNFQLPCCRHHDDDYAISFPLY